MKKVIVTTYGGKRTRYTDEQLQEFVDNLDLYYCADNLPKWIAIKFMTTRNLRFDLAYNAAIQWIKKAITSTTSTVINVRSDRPYKENH